MADVETNTPSVQSAAETTAQSRLPAPSKPLPTDRIKIEKQFDILRAYGASQATAAKPIANSDIGAIVNLTASTVSLGNAFWVANEFLIRSDGGYTAAPEVVAFANAYSWNAETAAHKMIGIVERSWFFRRLQPKLRFGELREDIAIQDLAEEASAAPKYKAQLATLIDYCVLVGLLTRDNGILKLAPNAKPSGNAAVVLEATPQPLPDPAPAANNSIQHVPPATPHEPDKGGLSMQFTIHVSASELASWKPERIAAFFKGIADIYAAKGKSGEEIA